MWHLNSNIAVFNQHSGIQGINKKKWKTFVTLVLYNLIKIGKNEHEPNWLLFFYLNIGWNKKKIVYCERQASITEMKLFPSHNLIIIIPLKSSVKRKNLILFPRKHQKQQQQCPTRPKNQTTEYLINIYSKHKIFTCESEKRKQRGLFCSAYGCVAQWMCMK